jgi:hypothetical protein
MPDAAARQVLHADAMLCALVAIVIAVASGVAAMLMPAAWVPAVSWLLALFAVAALALAALAIHLELSSMARPSLLARCALVVSVVSAIIQPVAIVTRIAMG